MHIAEKTMLSLAEFTSAGLIAAHLQTRTTSGVAQELSQLFLMHEGLPASFFLNPSVLCRELLTSTTLNNGMLIAHLRAAPPRRTCFALGRSPLPLPWRAKWLTPVQFVCLAVEAPSQSAAFGQMMTGLTRLASETASLDRLSAARTSAEMLAVLEQVLI